MRLFLISFLSVAASLSSQYSREYSAHSTVLQASLLSNYNPNVPPVTSQRSATSVAVSDAGTDVSLQIRVFKVDAVDAAHGQMRLKIWFRQNWKDERLAWNETEYGGISSITLNTDPEGRQLWVPDLQPYNALVSIDESLAYTTASVYSDGSIFWSRPGMLELMCKFSGLVAFPYDTLRCSTEIGGWSWSGSHQGIEISSSGAASISAQEATSGSSYTEYTVTKIDAEPVVYEYPCCPSEPWPVIFYTISLSRSDAYYFHSLIWPYILLTLVSFLPTMMSHEVGERLSFGITLILAIEVSKTLFQHMVPVCGELLWIELFMSLNLLFCVIALIETCIVLFLAYHSDPHLLPPWLMELVLACNPGKLIRRLLGKGAQRVSPGSEGADVPKARRGSVLDASSTLAQSKHANQWTTLGTKRFQSVPISLASEFAKTMGVANAGEGAAGGEEDKEEMCKRLSLFERCFVELDTKALGYLDLADVYSWLTFTCMSSSSTQIWETVDDANQDGDESLVRHEFITVCCDLLHDVPLERLITLHETHQKIATQAAEANVMRWRRAAKWVDHQARLVIPTTYLSLLCFLMNVDLSEPELESDQSYLRPWSDASKVATTGELTSEMFNGLWGVTPTASWAATIFATVAVPLIVIGLLLAWAIAVCSARRARVLQSKQMQQGRKNREVDMDVVSKRQSKRMSRRMDDGADDDVEELK